MRLNSQMVNKKITFINSYINQKCNAIASGCTVIVFLFLWNQNSIKNFHSFICHLLQLLILLIPLTLQLYLLISFFPSICGWCAPHGSLTVTIWIRSSYHSISAPRVSLLSLVTLATCIIIISLLLFISPCLLYSPHDPQYWHRTLDKQFFCLSVSVSSGHQHQCSARWQRLCLDGRYLQPVVSCGWHWGGEEECLREKHVCFFVFFINAKKLKTQFISNDNSHGRTMLPYVL